MTQASNISPRDEPRAGMHIGDLRLTEAELSNHLDPRVIVARATAHLARQLDFVALPGDNADFAASSGVMCRRFPVSIRATALRATDRAGSTGFDSIEATSIFDETRERHADESDRDTIGAWEEKHPMGTQRGAKRDGRQR